MSRTVQFSKTGGPEVLQIVEKEIAAPGKNEVRIKVKAIGLNRAESMFRSGQYFEEPILPATLGYEAAGTVEATGEGVTTVQVGDAVSVVPAFSLNQYGMYGELVLAPAHAVIKHPDNLSFEEAAAIWMMYVTAYDALIGTAGLTMEDIVLIPAASSSVGLAAIQIVNMVGGTAVALTRSSSKSGQLKEAGAAHVIATEEQDIVAEVMKLSGGKGANVVYDPVGGPTFAKLVAATAPKARIIIYGALSKEPTILPIFEVMTKQPIITGALTMNTSGDPAKLKIAVDFISGGLKSGVLKPIIARVFPFDQIVEAHKYLEANQQFGKVLVSVP
ncbi:MAG: zinc-dependent alcohol dehydrogenase family protein [Cyanobacteria bacterium SZAS TMP-1]|nr:zinc-dependent alcohol dehydrogenase family protein [Cyanobacteria bacterium SZAS TMP-1]